MKKIHFVIYICDNELNILNLRRNKIISEPFKSLKDSQIINKNLFYNEFNTFLIKNKIRLSLFGCNIKCLKNDLLPEIQLDILKEVFSDYFRQIKFINIEEILNVNKEIGYLNITNNYVDYYYLKKNKPKLLRAPFIIFNNNAPKTINHLLANIYKPRKIIVFGSNSNIPNLTDYINRNFHISATFSEFYQNYLLEKYKI